MSGAWDVDVSPVPRLPRRDREAHKGDFGHVIVIGGSRGMVGAAALAGQAALRSGAGLVTIACPESVYPILAAKVTCPMTLPLPETDTGALAASALEPLIEWIEARATAVAIGPGLGRHPETQRLVTELLPRLEVPWIADADALYAVAKQPGVLAETRIVGVLTPHAGEMARLIGTAPGQIRGQRERMAAAYTVEHRHVLVLKGSGTIVAQRGILWTNRTGNPGLATGGTGDVLTGAIAALLAEGLGPYAAARIAVHVHGRAGDLASAAYGERSVTASCVLDRLSAAYQEVTTR